MYPQQVHEDEVKPSRLENQDTSKPNRRKRLLLEILDALTELSSQDLEERDQRPSVQKEPGKDRLGLYQYEDPRLSLQDKVENPSEDPLQTRGVQALYSFRRHVDDLDKELQNLAQAIRSAGILSSSFQLRTRLSKILFLYNENATEIFPKIAPDQPTRMHLSTVRTLQGFPEEFDHLGRELMNFLRCLHEFPESKYERLNSSVLRFNGNLKYWASSLQDFKGQFRDPAVQRYMHDVCEEMIPHLHNVTSSIESFIEVVIPAIREVQQQEATTLVSLSGLATFMSAVTATAIQIAFDQTEGPLNSIVNVLWFSSLVLSISSAVNSLLVLVWTQSVYRSPRNRVPWWISLWIGKSHLVSLIAALITFSVGLVVFTWASKQALATRILTTTFTALSTMSLITVCVWFAFERLVFFRHGGRHLLADVISDLDANWRNHVLPHYIHRLRSWGMSQGSRARYVLAAIFKTNRTIWCISVVPSNNQNDCDGEGRLPISNPNSTLSPPTALPMEFSDRRGEIRHVSEKVALSTPPTSDPEVPTDKQLPTTQTMEMLTTEKSMQISNSSHYSLNRLAVTETLQVHQSTVSHLQFSPDGKWLATGSWDTSSVLFSVTNFEDPITSHRSLVQSRPVHQIAWAPESHRLLTNVYGPGNIRIWNEDGGCIKVIERPRPIRAVTWLPSGQGFMLLERDFFSLEGSEVSILDLNGNTLANHPLPRFYLYDVAVTPDERYMLCVAAVIKSPDGLQPHFVRRESRIVVYNLALAAIESQVPVSQSLDNIRISGNGQFVLVSCKYGGKEHQNPTQLWRLENLDNRAHLVLSHTYRPTDESDGASGSSCFGGRNDELVLIMNAGNDGHVSIWDRDSGVLLHDLAQPNGDLTSVAWNSGSDTPMLATGSFSGMVRVWTPTVRPPQTSGSGFTFQTVSQVNESEDEIQGKH